MSVHDSRKRIASDADESKPTFNQWFGATYLKRKRNDPERLTLDAIAADSNIAKGRVSEYSNGKRTPGHGAIQNLCQGLNVAFDDVYSEYFEEVHHLENLPLPPMRDGFQGRDGDMEWLRAETEKRKSNAKVAYTPLVCHGLGGVGKTRLAIEHGHFLSGHATARFFVFANSQADFDAGMSDLGRMIRSVPQGNDRSPQENFEIAIEWLKTHRDWFLIIDNVDDAATCQHVIKTIAGFSRNGQILVTSRLSDWPVGAFSARELLCIDPAAAAELILTSSQNRETTETDTQDASRLAKALGYLPLALAHAGSYINEHKTTIKYYLHQFETNIENVLAYDNPGALGYAMADYNVGHLKNISATFLIALKALDALEKSILFFAAHIAAEPFPREFLSKGSDAQSDILNFCSETPGRIDEAVIALSRYSLITIEKNGGFKMHQLVQAALRVHLGPEEHVRWLEAARLFLLSLAPDESAESANTWTVWTPLRSHVSQVLRLSENSPPSKSTFTLLSKFGAYHFGLGLFRTSIALDVKCLEIEEQLNGKDTSATADILLAIGEAHRELGELEDALQALEDSARIRKKIDGANSERVAVIYNYLGLAQQNDRDSKRYYRRAIKIHRRFGKTANHQDFAKVLGNLASILAQEGKRKEAGKLIDEALGEMNAIEGAGAKPQLRIEMLLFLSGLAKSTKQIESALDEVEELIQAFPENHFLRDKYLNRRCRFLASENRLAEAKALARGFPERGQADGVHDGEASAMALRPNLRLLESILTFDLQGQLMVNPATSKSMDAAGHNMSLNGVSIRDLRTFGFTFHMGGMSDFDDPNDASIYSKKAVRMFSDAIATDDSEHWGTGQGAVSARLKATALGQELSNSGRIFDRFLRRSFEASPRLKETITNLATKARARNADRVEIEVWLSGGTIRIYNGPLKDIGIDEPDAFSSGYLIDNAFEVRFECRAVGPKPERIDSDAAYAALRKYVRPKIIKAAKSGGEFSNFRLAKNCVELATWAKDTFGRHKDFVRFVETYRLEELDNVAITSLDGKAPPIDRGEAEARLERAIKDHGAESERAAFFHNELSVILRRMGTFKDALPHAVAAAEIYETEVEATGPRFIHRWSNVALLHIAIGRAKEASKVVRRLESQSGDTDNVVTARLRLIGIFLDWISGQSAEPGMTELKSQFRENALEWVEGVRRTWDVETVVDTLPQAKKELGRLLTQAVNERATSDDLENQKDWIEAA